MTLKSTWQWVNGPSFLIKGSDLLSIIDFSNANSLSAPAAFDDHIFIIFEHNLSVLVLIQHRNGREVGGNAAGLGDGVGVHAIDQGLHNGVIGAIQMIWEGKSTFPNAATALS